VKAVTRIIRAELLKIRKRSLTWILLYVLVGLMVIVHFLLFLVSRINIPGQGFPGAGDLEELLGLPLSIPFALSTLTAFGAVLAVILVASSVGNEYNWRTIRIALISSEGRLKFLGAKLIAIAIVILIGMVIGVATGFIMGLITTAIGGNPYDFSFLTGSYLWNQFLQFWRTFFMLMPFTMIGFLFGIVGRSVMPGIAVGIGVLFLEPIITSFMALAGGWVSSVPKYLFNANINAINALNKLPLPDQFSGGMVGATARMPSVIHAFTILSAYIVVFTGLAFYIFHKRDVTG
jgi:ABC-2 type transport system permease protein